MALTSKREIPMLQSVWQDDTTLQQAYATSLIAATPFRGQKKIPQNNAEGVYEALSKSPFVSLYSTASAAEDFAELVAWYELSRVNNFNVVIVVESADAKSRKYYVPLEFSGVKQRLTKVGEFLSANSNL